MPVHFQVDRISPAHLANVEALSARARALAEAPHRPYQGERVFPMPQELLRAAEIARQGEGSYIPSYNEAQGMLRNSSNNDFAQQMPNYMNPYQQHVIRNMENEGLRTFREKVLPEIDNRFMRLGQHGSSGHREMTTRAARDFQRELMERRQHALSQGYDQGRQHYNTDKTRQLLAAKDLAGLGAMRQAGQLADIGALEGMGLHKQSMGQRAHDINFENYLRDISRPAENLNLWSSVLNGLPYQTATNSYSNPVGAAPQLNAIGNIGSIASSILGMRRGVR